MSDFLPVKVPAERPVDPMTIALLRAVKTACGTLEARFVLAGATARDILFLHLYGITAPTATRDVDVAVCVVDWEFHERLVELLLASGEFRRDPKAQQKLHFHREDDAYSMQLDLVPFGPVEDPQGAIAWPPDNDIIMNVLGFQEAVDTAQQIDIGESLEVGVVSIPAFVLLKLMAWKDRRATKNTDASDLLFVMRHYFSAGNEGRVFEEAQDLLEACDYRVEIGCAGLLGRDARRIASTDTHEAVRVILETTETFAALKADLLARAAAFSFGEFVGDSDELLDAFAAQFLLDAAGHATL